jgi:hypothetical protein
MRRQASGSWQVMLLQMLLPLLLLLCSATVPPVHSMALMPAGESSFYDRFSLDPPRKPEHFHNINELTQYLDELKQYYTLLGRPR